MKKEINALLAQERGWLRINNITDLHRWKKSAIGEEVDRLTVGFDSPTGRVCFYTKEIKSRTPKEIMEEVAQATAEFAQRWAEETMKEIRAGRLG